MATVSNVRLSIEKGTNSSRRNVAVTYQLNFNHCEVLDGTTYWEKVLLKGDDPVFDDNLVTLRNRCVKASKSVITRSIKTSVSKSRLDEDGDTVIFGFPVFANRDELYVNVELVPFKPSKASGRSNIVTGQFGAAGND